MKASAAPGSNAMPTAKTAAKTEPKKTAKTVTEQLIREIAHRLWVEEGHPDGRADDHWFKALEIAQAKKTIAAKKATANSDKAPVKKAIKKSA
jgi:hypothetical protein